MKISIKNKLDFIACLFGMSVNLFLFYTWISKMISKGFDWSLLFWIVFDVIGVAYFMYGTYKNIKVVKKEQQEIEL